MLSEEELIIDSFAGGQVARIGNYVCPQIAAAIVSANVGAKDLVPA